MLFSGVLYVVLQVVTLTVMITSLSAFLPLSIKALLVPGGRQLIYEVLSRWTGRISLLAFVAVHFVFWFGPEVKILTVVSALGHMPQAHFIDQMIFLVLTLALQLVAPLLGVVLVGVAMERRFVEHENDAGFPAALGVCFLAMSLLLAWAVVLKAQSLHV